MKKRFKKNTKLSKMQHNQFIPTFQLLVGLLFPEIKNSLGEIVYQQTTCPLILHWKIEVSWNLPCKAAISDLWQSVEVVYPVIKIWGWFRRNEGVNACTHKCQILSEFHCYLTFEVNFINFTLRSKCIVIFKTIC